MGNFKLFSTYHHFLRTLSSHFFNFSSLPTFLPTFFFVTHLVKIFIKLRLIFSVLLKKKSFCLNFKYKPLQGTITRILVNNIRIRIFYFMDVSNLARANKLHKLCEYESKIGRFSMLFPTGNSKLDFVFFVPLLVDLNRQSRISLQTCMNTWMCIRTCLNTCINMHTDLYVIFAWGTAPPAVFFYTHSVFSGANIRLFRLVSTCLTGLYPRTDLHEYLYAFTHWY